MILPDVQDAVQGFIDATRPFAAAPADLRHGYGRRGVTMGLASVRFVVSPTTGVHVHANRMATKSPTSHHEALRLAAIHKPVQDAAQALWDTLTGHAPILLGAEVSLSEIIYTDGGSWKLSVCSREDPPTPLAPEQIAQALCRRIALLQGRPHGVRRFDAKDLNGDCLTLFAASPEDAYVLWHAAHIDMPMAKLAHLTEVHDLATIRANTPIPLFA